jgi:hypothetical protein
VRVQKFRVFFEIHFAMIPHNTHRFHTDIRSCELAQITSSGIEIHRARQDADASTDRNSSSAGRVVLLCGASSLIASLRI